MLCEAGIASMAELLDPNGVWTAELLELMIPVALDVSADRTAAHFAATSAAVSLIGGKKGAESFQKSLKNTKDAARAAMRRARGLPPERAPRPDGDTPADEMMRWFAQMGLKTPKRGKKSPQDTRKH